MERNVESTSDERNLLFEIFEFLAFVALFDVSHGISMMSYAVE